MGIKSTLKKGISFGFQPKRWFGVEQVKANGKVCTDLAQGLLAKHEKTSEQLQVAEKLAAEIQNNPPALLMRKRLALVLMLLYLAAGFAAIGYAVFLWLVKSFILPGSVSFVLSFLLFSYSVREFMVYAQICCANGEKLPLKILIRRMLARCQKNNSKSGAP